MKDNKTLAESIAAKLAFTPSDDRLLIKPLKTIMVTKELPVEPNSLPKNVEEAEAQEVKFEKKQVPANVQKGIVIKLGSDYNEGSDIRHLGLELGDVVYYPRGGGQAFEAFKDSRLLRRYEVLAVEK